MNLPEVPLIAMLRESMNWLHLRQNVLSENVANADTPGYVAKDLKPLNFEDELSGVASANTLVTTNARHISSTPSQTGQFEIQSTPDEESSPDGGSVSLEMEMIKVSDTQAQFQAAANLYAKAMSLMKTAIGH